MSVPDFSANSAFDSMQLPPDDTSGEPNLNLSFGQQVLEGRTGSILRRRSTALATALATSPAKKKARVEADAVKAKRKSFGPRKMSVAAMRLHGVEDESSREMFTMTMGVDDEGAKDLIESEDPYNIPFESKFVPSDMRCLALVAHNHMKPAMKEFVLTHKEILKKFRLTGTNTTITMLKSVFGDDPTVEFGPGFTSGPLGGDAELCALMCLEDLGGLFFFMDPLSAHPHQADIDCLVRLANVHNVLTCTNPCSAHAMSFLLKNALLEGRKDKIPSFFFTLKSPGVAVYKEGQKKALEANK